MKKSFITASFIIVFAAASIAQSSFDLYKFNDARSAAMVISNLDNQLKLTVDQLARVQELINNSAQSQLELNKTQANLTPDMQSMIAMRQTMHIETNLKEILGDAGYSTYLQLKPAIEQKVSRDIHSTMN